MRSRILTWRTSERNGRKIHTASPCSSGDFRRRYYLRYCLPSQRAMANIVRRRRNFVLRKGFCFASTVADNDFDTELLEEISAQIPCFYTSYSPPHAHVKVAEADIKAWRLRVRQVMKSARSDPKLNVQIKHWPYALECITDIEICCTVNSRQYRPLGNQW